MTRGIFVTGTDTGVSALTRGRAAASRDAVQAVKEDW